MPVQLVAAMLNEKIQVSPQKLLTLEDVGIQHSNFVMRPLNEAHIKKLVDSKLTNVPPIKIVKTGKGIGVVDGYHRREAGLRLGYSTLECVAGNYASEEDVIIAAFEANLQHGLSADKNVRGRYAVWLSINKPLLKQDEIARKAGISQPAVSQAIKRYNEVKENNDNDAMYIGRIFTSLRNFVDYAKDKYSVERGDWDEPIKEGSEYTWTTTFAIDIASYIIKLPDDKKTKATEDMIIFKNLMDAISNLTVNDIM